MATTTKTVEDWQNATRATFQNLPYSWRANFLQQPPGPWYNNATASVPPATATPAPQNASAFNQMAGTGGGFSLNDLLSNSPLVRMLTQRPGIGPMMTQATQPNQAQQTMGGFLNRLFMGR
jgi:hypothetical protein